MPTVLRPRFGGAVPGRLRVAGLLMGPSTARAGPSKVGFDVSYCVECRDVTPAEFAEANPDGKIIEARFQVSTLIRRGQEKDIKELMYVISSPERRLRVADFAPKTRVESPVTDAIEIIEKGEDATSLNGSVAVQIGPLEGVHLTPSAGVSKMKKQNLEWKYSRLPPKQLLLASGTTNREHGVFFKLKPSSQASLEGQREFICLFLVPKGWRGDYAYVDCTARPRNRSPWTTPEDYGSKRVLVGLYLQGDAEAQEAVERLAHAHEAYVGTGGSGTSPGAKPDRGGRFLTWLPVSSIVESVIQDLADEDEKVASKKDEAWNSFRTALEDVARFTG
ncbi:MAG: hypothetical protein ABIP48_25755, partial [Planctomycetota bacterium]